MTRERFGWILTGLIVGIALAMLGVTPSIGEETPTGQALVDAREQAMKKGGGALQYLLKYDGSDSEKAQAAAKALDDAGDQMLSWFPQGTGPGDAGITKTHAKAEIWSNWADFQTKHKAYDDAVAELVSVASGPDADAIKAAAMKVGGTCKGCHDTYKMPDEH